MGHIPQTLDMASKTPSYIPSFWSYSFLSHASFLCGSEVFPFMYLFLPLNRNFKKGGS